MLPERTTYTVEEGQPYKLPMGKLEHGHNDRLFEGRERSGPQCDKTILKMGGTRGNVSICGSL